MTNSAQMQIEEACSKFLDWLEYELLSAGRGDRCDQLEVEPSGRFWLGRLAPQALVVALGMGERGERLDPCAAGLIIRLSGRPPWSFVVRVTFAIWLREAAGHWRKVGPVSEELAVTINDLLEREHGEEALRASMAAIAGIAGFAATVRTTAFEMAPSDWRVEIELVNTTPSETSEIRDPNLYQCSVEVVGLSHQPFLLEALPDSFRYDRRVPAYGINCGVSVEQDVARTIDTPRADRMRPKYWNATTPEPCLRFDALAIDPCSAANQMLTALEAWGEEHWSERALSALAQSEGWTLEMQREAAEAAVDFFEEVERCRTGLGLLREDQRLREAFSMMNEAMSLAARGSYDAWRPFQFGFLLANLAAIGAPEAEQGIADVVWFATGGGKTETYLGLIVTTSFYDRLAGKLAGVTAWSRFPLRMLSLQQTQRFANSIAAAELIRRRHAIGGEPFSVGFLVGEGATPNRIRQKPKDGEPDPLDPSMPGQFRVLECCPFCRSLSIDMGFDRKLWTLEHRCTNEECPWPERGLPFYIVDEEIYRFLPTVLVGTLDKVASIAVQAAMRGLVGAPRGRCSRPGHGFIYAPRSTRPTGCLVPGCLSNAVGLGQPPETFAPSLRLQDELHLLKDSLGAVDAHYEALLDHIQLKTSGRRAKILASSATLAGFEKQCDVLYQRRGRVFPQPGPSTGDGFWTSDSTHLARRFVAIAPRGVTLEYAVDRTITVLQKAVRRLRDDPDGVCVEAGVDRQHATQLLSLYGTNVLYGNTLRDLDASMRSLETQVAVDGNLRTALLTGRTQFDDVRRILDELENPPQNFDDRLHVVGASAMMSHGVDVNRLNVMVMLGLPLTTAEFIQATARVGRKWPGLVFVMHKIARERDASVYRSFPYFVGQGDRFLESVPITRRSRRVLDCTIAGLELGRILALHEPNSAQPLTLISKLRDYMVAKGVTCDDEVAAIVEALGLTGDLDAAMREDLAKWMRRFFRDLNDPGGEQRFPSDLSPSGSPMISLRDVEEQVTIRGMLQ
jgi:hypothetical protein